MKYAYSSPLRREQADATRRRIVEAAMALAAAGGEAVTHEAAAERSGVAVRTVYRHFPARADLVQAMWESLKQQTSTEFPDAGDDIPKMAVRAFRNLDRNESLVRAFLASGAGGEVRDRGSFEGRPAFRRCLEPWMEGLPERRKAQITAVFLALYSAPAWQMIRDRGGLRGAAAAGAVEWAMEALLQAVKNESRRKKNEKRRTDPPRRGRRT